MKKIQLPKDSAGHNYAVEWWYFNGHLHDKKKKEFAYMYCLFKVDPKKANLPLLNQTIFKNHYFSHFVLIDVARKKSYPQMNHFCLLSKDSFTKDKLYINYINPFTLTDYVNCHIKQTSSEKIFIKNDFIDLRLTANKKPLLVGGNGYVKLNHKSTYYYSMTDLKTGGYLNIKGDRFKVRGKSWMDHQWANSAYSKDSWTWFSIQLDNKTELLCIQYGDNKTSTRLASIIFSDGSSKHFDSFEMYPLGDTWQSKKTKARYDLSWKITLNELKLELIVRSKTNKQEMIFGRIYYWEGPTAVSGKMLDKKVKGDGFLEIVGQPGDYTNLDFFKDVLVRNIKEAQEKIRSLVKQIKKAHN